MAILDADGARRTREWDEARFLAHYAASLTAFAHHDPKHLPEFQPSGAAAKPKPALPDEVAQAQVRGWFRARAKKAVQSVPAAAQVECPAPYDPGKE